MARGRRGIVHLAMRSVQSLSLCLLQPTVLGLLLVPSLRSARTEDGAEQQPYQHASASREWQRVSQCAFVEVQSASSQAPSRIACA